MKAHEFKSDAWTVFWRPEEMKSFEKDTRSVGNSSFGRRSYEQYMDEVPFRILKRFISSLAESHKQAARLSLQAVQKDAPT